MRRRENLPLVQGRGRFLDDRSIRGTLYATIVRSPYAHARILEIDGSFAEDLDGVVAVVTARDLEGHFTPINFANHDVKAFHLSPLATGKVRYVGDPVAVVLSTDKYVGEDAVEQVFVDYETLPPVAHAGDALRGESLLHEEWGDNVAMDVEYSNGDVDAAFAAADHVVKERFRMHRHAGTPIEPRGILAEYEFASDHLTVWSTTHVPHLYRTSLSECLGLDESRVRAIAGNIGGSYGTKSVPNAEDMLIPLLSKLYKRPVKWVETRSENLIGLQAREQVHDIELALDKDGTILGIRDSITLDIGAYPNRTGPIEGFNSACFVPGCYRVQNYAFKLVGVVTNKSPLGPYRGFGKSSPNYVIERIVDVAARELGLDVAEIRRRNLVTEFPHRNPVGAVYDSGSYLASLELALEMLGYDALREEQERERANGRYIGIGVSSSLDPSGHVVKDAVISAYDAVTVRVSRTGRITILTGACGLIGTSHETAFAGVAAEILGVPPEWIDVVEGDTLACPVGQGSFSDRSAIYTASAVRIAAEQVRDKLLQLAAGMERVQPSDLKFEDGHVRSKRAGRDGGIDLSVPDLARMAFRSTYALPEGLHAGLESTHYFSLRMRPEDFFPGDGAAMYYPCFGNSCHIAVVEVDPETGIVKLLRYVMVHDAGKIIDPDIVEGQAHGGIVAGVGGALMEELVYDADGQLVTGTFMDYLVPTAVEIPAAMEVAHLESPSPKTPMGAKGVGEGGTIGAYGALSNAVEDALVPFGVRVNELPLKPDTIWRAVRSASAAVASPTR
jgi:carbon-monoxide dehydrogenase large subunit